MNQFHEYLTLVRRLTGKPAETKPYNSDDDVKTVLALISVLSLSGAGLALLAKILG